MTLHLLIFTHLDGRELGRVQSTLVPEDHWWVSLDGETNYQVTRIFVDYSGGQEVVRIKVAG